MLVFAIFNSLPCHQYEHLGSPYITLTDLLISGGVIAGMTAGSSFASAFLLFRLLRANTLVLGSVVFTVILVCLSIHYFQRTKSYDRFFVEGFCSLVLITGSQIAAILLAYLAHRKKMQAIGLKMNNVKP